MFVCSSDLAGWPVSYLAGWSLSWGAPWKGLRIQVAGGHASLETLQPWAVKSPCSPACPPGKKCYYWNFPPGRFQGLRCDNVHCTVPSPH